MIIGSSTRLLASSVRGSARSACAACETAAVQRSSASGRQQQRSAHKLVQVQLTTDIPSLGSRGSIVITSPGRARNQLIPSGLALYVNRDGKPVSAARDMDAKANERLQGELMGWSRTRRESERDRRAKAVLDGLAGSVTADPLAPARAADRALAQSLSSLTPSLLRFTRLTTSPTSHDLFGSVLISDVLTLLRESGALDAKTAGSLSEADCHFDENQDGVVSGRVKKTGTFKFVVELKAIQEKKVLRVEVEREEAAKAATAL
ncbi:hypothetical protein JCM10908_005370 [Rhodotorula pacifica]|uniref:bL9 family ribosomal protein n=1 Tax=Rhodotorula pacifica TaxID=1495444 RepID=UPI0031764008